jgi:hypothetical protein
LLGTLVRDSMENEKSSSDRKCKACPFNFNRISLRRIGRALRDLRGVE